MGEGTLLGSVARLDRDSRVAVAHYFLWHLQCGILLGWENLHIHQGGRQFIAFRGLPPWSVGRWSHVE